MMRVGRRHHYYYRETFVLLLFLPIFFVLSSSSSSSSAAAAAAAVSGVASNSTTADGNSTASYCRRNSPAPTTGTTSSSRDTLPADVKLPSSSTSDDDDNDDRYEPSEVAWCRRQPSWRPPPHTVEDNNKNDTSEKKEEVDVYTFCSTLLHYAPDPQKLIQGNHPFVSSFWNTTYTFEPARIEDEIEKQTTMTTTSLQTDDTPSSLSVLERPLLQHLIQCMDTNMKLRRRPEDVEDQNQEDAVLNTTTTRKMLRPAIKKVYSRTQQRGAAAEEVLPLMMVIEHALTELEVRSIEVLAECLTTVGDTKNFSFQQRSFSETDHGGGNEVTFLAGFVQLLLPGVAYQVKRIAHVVWSTAQWGARGPTSPTTTTNSPQHQHTYSTEWWPNPLHDTTGIRTTEYLTYEHFGHLGYHQDDDSLYTVLIALSDPDEYEGGAFTFFPNQHGRFDDDDDDEEEDSRLQGYAPYPGVETCTNQTEKDTDKTDNKTVKANQKNNNEEGTDIKISFKPQRFEAIVFLSPFTHGVETITTPGRTMFATELWRYDDAPTFVHRPSEEDIRPFFAAAAAAAAAEGSHPPPNPTFPFHYPNDEDERTNEDDTNDGGDDDDDDDNDGDTITNAGVKSPLELLKMLKT